MPHPLLVAIQSFRDDRNFWRVLNQRLEALGCDPVRLLSVGTQEDRFGEGYSTGDFDQSVSVLLNSDADRQRRVLEAWTGDVIALVDQTLMERLPPKPCTVQPTRLFLCGWADKRPDAAQIRLFEAYFGCPVEGVVDENLCLTLRAGGSADPAMLLSLLPSCSKASSVQPDVPADKDRRSILFVTSNGVGLGHLTRCLAIAKRMDPARFDISFASMSRAVPKVEEFGFDYAYVPGPDKTQGNAPDWDAQLEVDLAHHINRTRADTLIFDGNYPYPGLRAVLDARLCTTSIWIRRAMWRRSHRHPLPELEKAFSLVVEPGDVAEAFDVGITTQRRDHVAKIGPVTLLDTSEILDRTAARAALGAGEQDLVGVLQIGALSNNTNGDMAKAMITALQRQMSDGLKLIWIANPIADPVHAEQAAALGLDIQSHFPLQQYARGIDFSIVGGGYNSVHEAIQARIPCVYIPNEGGMMDAQLTRAQWVETCGGGLVVRAHEFWKVDQAMARVLSSEDRSSMADVLDRMAFENGASDGAKLIQNLILNAG